MMMLIGSVAVLTRMPSRVGSVTEHHRILGDSVLLAELRLERKAGVWAEPELGFGRL
jgi:hypothetical protein